MQLTLRENSAILEREGHQPVTLHVDWIDETTLSIDWSPVNERWGRSQLRGGNVGGSAGLIEENHKFWKLHVVLHGGEVTSASSGLGSRFQDRMNRVAAPLHSPNFSAHGGRGMCGLAKDLRRRCAEVVRLKGSGCPSEG